jgi:magnesium transporter
MLVGFGLDEQLRELVEVHCYYTTGFLITLRRAPSPALDALRQAGSVQSQLGGDPIRALHPVISSLYTQFSALCLRLDERLETLEQRVLHKADDAELAEITAIRHRAAVLRRIVRQFVRGPHRGGKTGRMRTWQHRERAEAHRSSSCVVAGERALEGVL